MAGCMFFARLAFLGVAGLSLLTSDARAASFQLNCDGLGAVGIREAAKNDDIRNSLSDFLVMTLPSGVEVNLLSDHGANVWNWTNGRGIYYSSAPSWPREQLTFESASYGIRQGTYLCDVK